MSEDKCQVYTVREAAEILGVNKMTIHREIERGNIPASKIGARILISKEYINRLVNPEGNDGDGEKEHAGEVHRG